MGSREGDGACWCYETNRETDNKGCEDGGTRGRCVMAYIEGKQRGQHTLFPTTLDELIPQDHVCRVIEAFVDRLDMAKLGFCSL